LHKSFGNTAAVVDVSLSLARGEFFSLLGPSGCGKSTLLRLFAGLEAPERGTIRLEGVDFTRTPPWERPVNMMFQSYALFPHLNVKDNIAYGLRRQRMQPTELQKRVREMLALVQMESLGSRRPHELSGGQRQRAALARALARHPKLLLLDEPLAALDKKLREQTRLELKRIQREVGIAFILVTHDQEEAMALSDRIAVMDQGRIVQIGPPAEIYRRPANRWVAEFVGDINLCEGRAAGHYDGHQVVEFQGSSLRLRLRRPEALANGTALMFGVRPEDIRLTSGPHPDGRNEIEGIVNAVSYFGPSVLCHVQTPAGVWRALTSETGIEPTQLLQKRVSLSFAPDAALLFPS
jgi:putrescine transport system ATP-binding protein